MFITKPLLSIDANFCLPYLQFEIQSCWGRFAVGKLLFSLEKKEAHTKVHIFAASGQQILEHPGSESCDIRAMNPALSGQEIPEYPGKKSRSIRATNPATSGQQPDT